MNEINVKDFLKGDGVLTEGIQKAIDSLGKDGGTVYFPPGTYITGTIFLKSNVTLHIDTNAKILGSDNPKDYEAEHVGAIEAPSFSECLIYAENADNIEIKGNGTIDGNGKAFSGNRPMLMRFVNCKNVKFSDTDVFAIYSTDNAKDPTVLYASKGKKAETERNRLLDILEVEKNVKNANGTSGIVGRVSSGNWMQNAHGMAGGGNGLPGSKSGVGNATVLQGKSSANGSRAFRNVIESLFKISSEGRGGRDGIKHSLKRNGALAKDSENKPIYI